MSPFAHERQYTAALNSSAPFLIYLTVFKSRVGIANVVLPLASFAYQPAATISRVLRERLAATLPLSLTEPANFPVFEYLLAKNMIGSSPRGGGRYKDYCLTKQGPSYIAERNRKAVAQLPVFQMDVWMASPSVASTIGVPTPENTEELLEFCFQLGLLTRTKITWTAAGQLVANLRQHYPSDAPDNPFLLGVEAIAVLRQILEKDGLLLRELLGDLLSLGPRVARDAISVRLPTIAARAVAQAEALRLPPPLIAAGKTFVRLLKDTSAKYAKAAAVKSPSRGPGVLEHRTAPRLEWLTDLGVLSKAGFAKNAFDYHVTEDGGLLLAVLDRHPYGPTWADDVALGYWRASNRWATLRSAVATRFRIGTLRDALREGYRLAQRSVGPAPIREVCLAAAILRPGDTGLLQQYAGELIDWAASEPGLTVSGGRYTRRPELVHMSRAVLERSA